jgi:hypothetical protein
MNASSNNFLPDRKEIARKKEVLNKELVPCKKCRLTDEHARYSRNRATSLIRLTPLPWMKF